MLQGIICGYFDIDLYYNYQAQDIWANAPNRNLARKKPQFSRKYMHYFLEKNDLNFVMPQQVEKVTLYYVCTLTVFTTGAIIVQTTNIRVDEYIRNANTKSSLFSRLDF